MAQRIAQPREIFEHGCAFELASLAVGGVGLHLIQRSIQVTPGFMLGPVLEWPRAVNAAFAIELYFKCVLIDAGTPDRSSHNLRTLFGKLPSSFQQRLRTIYASKIADVGKTNSLARADEATDFDRSLDGISTDFEDLRYAFEKRHAGGFMSGSIFAATTRQLILQDHPQWKDLVTDVYR